MTRIHQGDIVTIDVAPSKGHEIKKTMAGISN